MENTANIELPGMTVRKSILEEVLNIVERYDGKLSAGDIVTLIGCNLGLGNQKSREYYHDVISLQRIRVLLLSLEKEPGTEERTRAPATPYRRSPQDIEREKLEKAAIREASGLDDPELS